LPSPPHKGIDPQKPKRKGWFSLTPTLSEQERRELEGSAFPGLGEELDLADAQGTFYHPALRVVFRPALRLGDTGLSGLWLLSTSRAGSSSWGP